MKICAQPVVPVEPEESSGWEALLGEWHRMINREYRRASTNFHLDKQGNLDKQGSEELFHQLEKAARSFLAVIALNVQSYGTKRPAASGAWASIKGMAILAGAKPGGALGLSPGTSSETTGPWQV